MARISNARTIRVDDATLEAIKQLGERFGLSLPAVVANAVQLVRIKAEQDKAFTLYPRIGQEVAVKKGVKR